MNSPLLFHVDAFTRTPFRGNAAGVVLYADALSATQMQDIARELKHSETAFVLAPSAPDHDVYIRYFTPSTEVPICGHATVAAHYARAHHLGLGNTTLRQKTGAGLQTIQVQTTPSGIQIEMQQGVLSFQPAMAGTDVDALTQALGLNTHDICTNSPVQIVSTGHSKVMVPLRAHVALDEIRPDRVALIRLSERIGCNGYFPFQLRSGTAATDGRMFAPAIGIDEDPVTGNANGPLGAYLVQHRLMPHAPEVLEFEGHQGRALRRDGIVHVRVSIAHETPVEVHIRGDAVILFTAKLTL